ncbi:MAG: hypothetical protein ACRD2J_07255 [Thermoanaerobaculia bacterium]
MKRFAVLSIFALAIGCGGALPDLGDLGDILGSAGAGDESDVRGTVTNIDESDRRIDLDVSYINNLRDEQRGSIYWDGDTVVEFEGQTYRPEDLERGDEISAVGSNRNGRWVADRITVLRDVSR